MLRPEDHEAEATEAMLDDAIRLAASSKDTSDAAVDFIGRYATINIVRDYHKPMGWIAPPSSGSRGPVVQYLFACTVTPGCLFKRPRKANRDEHETACDEALVERARQKASGSLPIPCDEEGSGDTFGTRNVMKDHYTIVHAAVAITCEQCGKVTLPKNEHLVALHLHSVPRTRCPDGFGSPNIGMRTLLNKE